MLQEGARIAEVEFKVKSNCLTLKQGQRKIRKIMRGKGWVGLVAIEGCLRKKVLYLNTKDKVEKILEQRQVAFLSPSKICENLNFNFAG